MRNPNAPLHAHTPPPDPASAAPDLPYRNGTSRRAFLGLAAALWATRARAEGATLTAGPGGYDGASPGPVLRARAGEPLRLTLVNGLDRPTSLRLPGFLSEPLAPGGRRDIATVPRCGFDLYGPVDAADPALFGAVVVDDGAPTDFDLIALLSGDGRVNGGVAPLRAEARPGARVRLRIANAAQDAFMLRASGGDARIVAIDGHPCDPFAARDGSFPACPGARFELMFDLDAPFALSASGPPLVTISPVGDPLPKGAPRTALPADPRLPAEIALENALQVRIALGADGRMNGGAGKTLFSVRRGKPVTLTLVNMSGEAETLRLEAHAARILHAFDDGFDPYWRDVLALGPGQTLHAAFVADAPGRWPLASVSPQRRAKGRIGWFTVV